MLYAQVKTMSQEECTANGNLSIIQPFHWNDVNVKWQAMFSPRLQLDKFKDLIALTSKTILLTRLDQTH